MKTPVSFSAGRNWPARTWQRLLPLMALFVALGSGFTARAQQNSNTGVTNSSVLIDRGAGNQTYGGKNGIPSPAFDAANLGNFDVSNFGTTLLLNGGSLFTTEGAPDVVNTATLSYQVSSVDGSQSGQLRQITLPQTAINGNNKTFLTNAAMANLLTGLSGSGTLTAGTYTVDVFFTANGRTTVNGPNGVRNVPFILNDPSSTGFTSYQATFTVTGVRPAEPPTSTTWTGGQDDNWFDARNWSNGIPNRGKDATIPDFGSGSTVQYPNIYSNTVKAPSTRTTTIQNSNGTTSTVVTPVPGYDNTNSGPAETRAFTLRGTSQAQRSISRLIVGRLNVFGDFNNQQDSFIQRENTILSFAGTNQTISGSASGLVNVEIDGGGIKSLTTNFAIQSGGTLNFISGILQTDISNVNVSFVSLSPATNVNNVGIPSARVQGETETSYLRGYMKISEVARAGTTQDFGNIGISLNFIGNEPGIVAITRNTAENYGSVNNGSNGRPTIRRIFGVRPADQGTNTSALNATLTFRYLDNELTNLNPNSQTLNESNLTLFVSTSAGDTFGQLGRDALDTSTNTLVKNNVSSFGTFTLSEFTSPLPVTLTAFSAKRVGSNAEITWETVTELNSKGYEVQVSNDGRTYRTLAFVASANPNSTQLLRYRYLDTEAGKAGVRYYRLRQLDLDGTDHYYAPKVLTFEGGAVLAKAEVRGFPNPFTQELYLTANTSVAGPAQLSVTDLTGRVVSQQTLTLNAGLNDLTLQDAAGLKSGVYLVRLVLPTGETTVLRVSKN